MSAKHHLIAAALVFANAGMVALNLCLFRETGDAVHLSSAIFSSVSLGWIGGIWFMAS